MKTLWLDHFPALSRLSSPSVDSLIAGSQIVTLARGRRLFGPGEAPANYLLLLRGTIRVQQLSESGREIVLYRIAAGESCALTTACLMGYDDYPAEAIVEDDVEAVAINRNVFDDLISGSAEFRRFVFAAFSQRVTDLLCVIEEVAFARIDIRLAQKLMALADSNDCVSMTHQQLAVELGTAREVISRQLRDFQRHGWIKGGRGHVELSDREAITNLAGVK